MESNKPASPPRPPEASAVKVSNMSEIIKVRHVHHQPWLFALVALVVGPLLLAGGYWWWGTVQARQRAAKLELKLEEQRASFEEEIARLFGEERRAQFAVIEEFQREGVPWRKIRFVEFLHAGQGEVAQEHVFELPGTEVYVDAVAVKFEGEAVRQGKGRNFSVFRRVFSNRLAPDEGIVLYEASLRQAGQQAVASVPMERPGDGERYLELLRKYLANPAMAKGEGVRLIEGEAKYTNPRPGYYYELMQQASGGLIIEERRIPAVLDSTTIPKAQ